MGDKLPESVWNAFPSTSHLRLGPEVLPRRFGEGKIVAVFVQFAFRETKSRLACTIVAK